MEATPVGTTSTVSKGGAFGNGIALISLTVCARPEKPATVSGETLEALLAGLPAPPAFPMGDSALHASTRGTTIEGAPSGPSLAGSESTSGVHAATSAAADAAGIGESSGAATLWRSVLFFPAEEGTGGRSGGAPEHSGGWGFEVAVWAHGQVLTHFARMKCLAA